MHKHNSSHIDTSDYDSTSKTLKVRFKSGQEYHYHDVPPEVHKELIHAHSPGKVLHAKVKKAGFKFSKVT